MAAKLTPEQRQNIVDKYLEGMSGAEIARKFKHSTATIAKVLREEGVQVVKGRNNRWYEFNDHYLDELDCANKFWFLGYFYADGYLAPKGNSCSIDSVDKDAVEKCKRIFESNRPLQLHKATKKNDGVNRQDAWSFRLNSPIVYQNLINYGCDSDKSHTAKIPWWVFEGKEEFMRDFVRGLIDGDGSVSFKYGKYHRPVITLACTPQLAQELGDYLEEKLNLKIYLNKNKVVIWYIQITNLVSVVKFLDWTYYDGIECYMDRKYENSKIARKAVREYWKNNNIQVEE